MPKKEMVIDHRSLFRLFLIAFVCYALLWAVRYAGWYLFGLWGSLSSYDLMSDLLLFGGPVLLFLIILVTTLFAVFGGHGTEASPWRLLLYGGILLTLTIYMWWAITNLLIIGFS